MADLAVELLTLLQQVTHDPKYKSRVDEITKREGAIKTRHAEVSSMLQDAQQARDVATTSKAQAEKLHGEISGKLRQKEAEIETAYKFQVERDQSLKVREDALEKKAQEVTATEGGFAHRERALTERADKIAEQEADLKKRIEAFNRKIKAYEAA